LPSCWIGPAARVKRLPGAGAADRPARNSPEFPQAEAAQPSSTVLEKRIVQFGIRVDW
jgi:hypothetical protein